MRALKVAMVWRVRSMRQRCMPSTHRSLRSFSCFTSCVCSRRMSSACTRRFSRIARLTCSASFSTARSVSPSAAHRTSTRTSRRSCPSMSIVSLRSFSTASRSEANSSIHFLRGSACSMVFSHRSLTPSSSSSMILSSARLESTPSTYTSESPSFCLKPADTCPHFSFMRSMVTLASAWKVSHASSCLRFLSDSISWMPSMWNGPSSGSTHASLSARVSARGAPATGAGCAMTIGSRLIFFMALPGSRTAWLMRSVARESRRPLCASVFMLL
mmetsp:Transcript_63189/g.199900  ORF Transcript_63189/g.199900 Transcript_63189/m.199900 type:complete len:272 (-) Transcript_63189:218-1033(-)